MVSIPVSSPAGGTFFFTVRLNDPDSDLLVRHIELLRLAVRLCQFQHPFVIEDAVVLPDRIHTIWTLPPDDLDYARRWKTIKSTFVRHLPAARRKDAAPSGVIWQRRYWERAIVTPTDMAECRDLIRTAPVRAGLVADPRKWPYSRESRMDHTATGRVLHLVRR